MKQANKPNRNFFLSAISLLLFFLIWEISIDFLNISKTVLIKPSEIIISIKNSYEIILPEMYYSITEIVPGWLIGSLLGVIISVFIYRKEKIAHILISSSVFINAIPLIALSAILGGIMGTNKDQKILLVTLIVFFPMFISTLSSLRNLNQNYFDLLISYSANPRQILHKVLVPRSLPLILSTLKVSAISAIFTAITAEFFGGYGGIGLFILSKRSLYNLELVWGAIFCIAIFGALFYTLLEILQKKLVPWNNN